MMTHDLNEKIVVVTGSSSGLGYYIAKAFLDCGSIVVFNGRTSAMELRNVPLGQDRVYYVQADVTRNEDCLKLRRYLFDNFKKIDVIVCNVGNGRSVRPGSEHPLEWDRMLRDNLKSTTNTVESLEGIMNKNGAITCISSICGVRSLNAPIAYSVAKAALNHYVKCKARQLASLDIRMNAIAPGNLMFPGSVWEQKISDNPDAVRDMLEKDVPMNRFGSADEIARWVLHVSSSASSFATGQTFVIDGGQS